MTSERFGYARMVERNAGFLSATEQDVLRRGSVFVCGVGGMGGAAIQSLVRSGVQSFALADHDHFEMSNLNRQVFSGLSNIGRDKVRATTDRLRDINPDITVETYGAEWTERLDEILSRHKVVVNGMDDIAAGIHLYRRAQACGATVIDAYTAAIPSVTTVAPSDPRPEERLGYPTVGKAWTDLSAADVDTCKLTEVIYVLVHSSSADHIDLGIAAELLAGRRSRPSFAPMVITTGNLLAFEAIAALLGRRSSVGCRGAFFNPWTFAAERPRSAVVAAMRGILVRRMLRELSKHV